jgi:hypothetical protein
MSMSNDTNGTAMAVSSEPRDIATIDLTAVERVIVAGDLSKLSPDERWDFYQGVCRSTGLNPFTKPFEYITLNNKLTLYALKGATDQLRRVYGVSVSPPALQFSDGLVIVTVTATDVRGRTDTDLGIVTIEGLKGENRANAVMKAITKAKRRVTLSMCGLGMLDETEVETIPNARHVAIEEAHGEREEFDRARLERHYTALAAIATHAGHEQAERINKKKAADLDNDKLVGSVKVLRSWFPDITDEQLDAEQAD